MGLIFTTSTWLNNLNSIYCTWIELHCNGILHTSLHCNGNFVNTFLSILVPGQCSNIYYEYNRSLALGKKFLMPRYEYARSTFLFTQNTHLKILIKNTYCFHDVTLQFSKIYQKQKEWKHVKFARKWVDLVLFLFWQWNDATGKSAWHSTC